MKTRDELAHQAERLQLEKTVEASIAITKAATRASIATTKAAQKASLKLAIAASNKAAEAVLAAIAANKIANDPIPRYTLPSQKGITCQTSPKYLKPKS
jgi:hypothetical protein